MIDYKAINWNNPNIEKGKVYTLINDKAPYMSNCKINDWSKGGYLSIYEHKEIVDYFLYLYGIFNSDFKDQILASVDALKWDDDNMFWSFKDVERILHYREKSITFVVGDDHFYYGVCSIGWDSNIINNYQSGWNGDFSKLTVDITPTSMKLGDNTKYQLQFFEEQTREAWEIHSVNFDAANWCNTVKTLNEDKAIKTVDNSYSYFLSIGLMFSVINGGQNTAIKVV